MNTILSLLTILILSSLVLLSFYAIGKSIIGINKLDQDRSFPALLIGICLVVTTTYVTSKFGVKISTSLNGIFFIASILFLLRILQALQNTKKQFKYLASEIKNQAIKSLIASLIGIIGVIYPLRYFTRNENFIPIVSLGNNDVGSYLAQAAAINQSGFFGEGFIQNADYFRFTGVRDFGGPSFITYVSNLLNIELWSSFTITLVVVLSLIFIATQNLLYTIFKVRKWNLILVSGLVVINPVMFYLTGNNFLTQLIAIFCWISMFYGVLKCYEVEFKSSDEVIIITSASTIALYSYPHMGLIHAAIIVSSALASVFANRILHRNLILEPDMGNKSRNLITKLTTSLLLSFCLATPFLITATKLLFERGKDQVGWSLAEPVSFANLFVTGNFPDSALIPIWVGLSFILSIVIFLQIKKLIAWRSLKTNSFQRSTEYGLAVGLSLLAIPAFLYAVLAFAYGPESYRTWKFVFSFFPMLLPLFILHIGKDKFISVRYFIIVPLFILFLNSNYNSWLPIVNDPINQKKHATTRDLYELNIKTASLDLNSLNIELSPYFETMIAATVVASEKVYMNAPSYDLMKIDISTCTLVRNDDPKYLNTDGVFLNKTYKIVNLPSTCDFK